MATLTVLPGARDPKPFSMSARGVVKFMLASPYAARKVVEGYAFPKEDKARKILPEPAKEIVWHTFAAGVTAPYWKAPSRGTRSLLRTKTASRRAGDVR